VFRGPSSRIAQLGFDVKGGLNYYRSYMSEPNPIPISGEVDFGKLLTQLADDIVTAPEFLRMDDQLGECFEKYRDEVSQAAFFWDRVAIAVRETGRSRLARIYDQQKNALSLRTLLATIKANPPLFDDKAVQKRVNPVNPEYAQTILYPTLSVGDLKDASSLAGKLKAPAVEDRVSRYIRDRLRESTRQDLEQWQGPKEVPPALQHSVIEDLNAIIGGPSIWDADRFARVKIRQGTRNPHGEDPVRLNRLLLEDAYPLELSRGSHLPDPDTLKRDLAEVSCGDPLVHKIMLWRHHFQAHISSGQIIKKSLRDEELPTQDDAFKLCKRALDVFNRYSSLFHAVSLSKTIGEQGSIESVFRHLRSGLAAGRKEAKEVAERLLKAMESSNQA